MENLLALVNGLHRRRDGARVNPALMLAAFAATLFLSALMLFSVQPMFAKMALPKLGGAPAVWAVSMCFFQTALLAGYCYAHALNRWLEPARAVLVHLTLLAVTCLALPIGLPATLSDPPAGDAYLWLLGVLALGVGVPFFAVSANAPLLQAWFSKTGHSAAKDPYFLYGASNLGSLIALLAYPLALEPLLGLTTQSRVWTAGFLVLAVLIAACGMLMLQSRRAEVSPQDDAADATADAPSAVLTLAPTLTTRATWVALAAIPSGLMVAVTTYITTDIASAPFVWVVPLAIFLATFILVFKDKLAFNYDLVQAALPAAILVLIFFPAHLSAVLVAIAAFFLASLICHRELYLRRPDASRLTEFYIWMSLGGVIGGIFSALIAPKIFASVIEFKLLLLISLLCRPGVLLGLEGNVRVMRVALTGAAMAAAFLTYKWLVAADVIATGGLALYALIAASLIGVYLTRAWPEHRAVLVLAMIVGLTIMPGEHRTIYMERSFFGTMRVTETDSGEHRLMLHGTTVHGAQRLKAASGAPVSAADPATYYHPGSPMARGVDLARAALAASGKTFSVGIVGLGTGALACTAQPADTWRYYEIDPMVARIARDAKLFNFLSRCLPHNDIVFGDARLTLQHEPDAKFSYLVIDAFSSDAIPAHLLTREAIESYLQKLAPGGLIAMHISNRFLDLAPAIAATVATIPGVSAAHIYSAPTAPEPDATPSRVIFLSRDAALIGGIAGWADAKAFQADGAEPWTDDYSDVLSALIRRMTH